MSPDAAAPRIPQLVAVDVGNSFIHLRAYDHPRLASHGGLPASSSTTSLQLPATSQNAPPHAESLAAESLASLEQWVDASLPPTAIRWCIASVNQPSQQRLCRWLSEHRPSDRYDLLTRDDFDLNVDVEQPYRVGIDRLAAAVAANRLRSPDRPAIVIDSGSAITVDLITDDGCFQGGAILPGLRMAARALAENTDQLPEIRISEHPPSPVGKCTTDAIQAGLFWGLLGGIRELVTQIRSTLPAAPHLYVTGGGAVWQMLLEDYPDASYVPDLVLAGIAATGFAKLDRAARSTASPSTASCQVRVLTGSGRGAIAVLEIEGDEAARILQSSFASAAGKRIEELPAMQFTFGHWRTGAATGEEALVLRINDSRFELHCHGGSALVDALCDDLRQAGASLLTTEPDPATGAASEGPISSREAESSVRRLARQQLIKARTERTAAILLDQFRGAWEAELASVLEDLRTQDLESARARLRAILSRAELGRHLVEPFRVVLAGPPNVGKSSLINRLVGFERTIVDPMAGTTRDVVTTETAIEGLPLILSDTAGIRHALDAIESQGVSRARRAIDAADLVLLVADASLEAGKAGDPAAEEFEELRGLLGDRCLMLYNKADLAETPPNLSLLDGSDALAVSALTGEGVPELLAAIAHRLAPEDPAPGAAVPFSPGQVAALERALELLPEDIEGASATLHATLV